MLPNWLKQRAFLTPDRIALEVENEEITFQELHEQVTEMAKRIAALNVKKGDIVAVHMRNSLDMIVVVHALTYVGAVALLLNIRLSKAELQWQLQDAEPVFLITDESLDETIYRQYDIGTVKENNPCDMNIQEYFEEDDVHTILYTSGTTGHPKGVMLTYGNHYHSAIGSALNLGLQHDDCWLACLPFFHVSGLSTLVKNVVYGMKIVVQQNLQPSILNKVIEAKKITIVSVVFKIAYDMVEQLEQTYPAHFRCMLLGGGPAPLSFLETCMTKQVPVYQTYGMTETASQIVTLAPEYAITKIGSAGKVLFPCQLNIIVDGQQAKSKEAGEIVVAGPNVTKGYYKRETATKESLKNGWLHTGDMGYVDEEGFLYVLDRRKDMFVSGGENIYPAQIENVILSHSSVTDVGVIGVAHDSWGKVPIAFIVGDKVGEEELFAFCKSKLASYKIPKKIYFVDELPRNATKKLLRRVLQEWWEQWQ